MAEGVPETRVKLVDCTCNPGALGLMLLGWIVVLFAFAHLGFYPMSTMVLVTVFFTGFGFLLCTYIGFKRGELFLFYVFGPVSVFTLGFPMMNFLAKAGIMPAPTPDEIGFFFCIFALWIVALAFVTLRTPVRSETIAFFMAGILFFIGGLIPITGEKELLDPVFGVLGLATGLLLIYIGYAIAYNFVSGKQVLPLMIRPVKK